MKAKAIRCKRLPGYPTRLEVVHDPELLQRHLPSAWRRRTEMAGAITLFLAVNGAVQAADKKPAPLAADARAVVAPIFAHGDGRGSVGCVAVAPPVFLSEEEAMQVIKEELKQAGVDLSKAGVQLADVKVPLREAKYERTKDSNGKDTFERKVTEKVGEPLKTDAADTERRIAIEYVSEHDYFTLGGIPSRMTVQGYEFKEVAEFVAKQVEDRGKGIYFGTFYDPMAGKLERYPSVVTTEEWQKAQKEGRKAEAKLEERQAQALKDAQAKAAVKSKEELRAQVKDFVDWLKGQGAI